METHTDGLESLKWHDITVCYVGSNHFKPPSAKRPVCSHKADGEERYLQVGPISILLPNGPWLITVMVGVIMQDMPGKKSCARDELDAGNTNSWWPGSGSKVTKPLSVQITTTQSIPWCPKGREGASPSPAIQQINENNPLCSSPVERNTEDVCVASSTLVQGAIKLAFFLPVISQLKAVTGSSVMFHIA